MFYSPINYDEPVFRPPSEARSLIIQLTIGCSWNRCAFCEMYRSKRFSLRPEAQVFADIDAAASYDAKVRKVFLGDGNAMVLSCDKLLRILDYLRKKFPSLNRISAYAIPKDLTDKRIEELKKLRQAGLKLIYVGLESGDDNLLRMINKGETSASMAESLSKARAAGIKVSAMIINGLGGRNFSGSHAENSASLVNTVRPEYLSTLVLSFPFGIDHFKNRFEGTFTELTTSELLQEQGAFISRLVLEDTIFRSDHASNYLVLKGILNRDKIRILQQLDAALENPGAAQLREEWQRGL